MDLLATPAGPGTSQIVTRLRVARSHVPGGLNSNRMNGGNPLNAINKTRTTATTAKAKVAKEKSAETELKIIVAELHSNVFTTRREGTNDRRRRNHTRRFPDT